MASVQRLVARVALEDPRTTLEDARARAAAGDESWERWVEEYHEGKAIIVRLAVTVEVSNGSSEVVQMANRGVFLEKDAHPPKVEQQVSELVGKDFSTLARELTARGHDVKPCDLHAMYVHVELEEDVRRSLVAADGRRVEPRSDASLSRAEPITEGRRPAELTG